MRELLTGLAIVLIVVLTTILVAPYFVDWNGQRGFLEARLSRALGQQVTIGGNIDLKLLPTPYLVVDQVVVGGDDSPMRIGIRHLDLELSAAPLMHGEFDITEARLSEPTVRVTLQPDRTLPALPAAPAFTADVRFDRIHVANGTLAIADPTSGHTFLFDHLDFDADAGSFAGPFKVSGASGSQDARTNFRLSTSTPQKGSTHARLSVDETPSHARYEFDGTLDLQGTGDGAIRQRFDGTVAVAGHLARGGDAPIAWKLAGPFSADSTQATLESGELRLGGEDNGLTLTANARGDLRESPRMAFDLAAKQLDFDRLSGAPIDAQKPEPPQLPDLTTLRAMLASIRPPIRTALDLAIETATYGGETLSDLEAHVGLGAATQPLRITANGPGGAQVRIDGGLTLDDNPNFKGKVDVAADNLPRAAEWLASVAPSFPWKGSDIRFRTVKLDGDAKFSDGTFASDQLKLTLDRSVLAGKAQLALGDGAAPPKLTADLGADPLDLDGLPSFESLRGRASPLDLDIRLDAKAIKVSKVGNGTLDTGHIKLAFTKSGRRAELKQFRADDLGGATLDATGSLDAQHATFAATLDAKQLDQFAGLVRQLTPGAIADTLVERASRLAPAKIKLDADFVSANGGMFTPSRFTVVGTLGETKIEVSAKPEANRPDTGKAETGQFAGTAVTASLAAPNGGDFLGQFGIKALPIATIGAAKVTLSARGKGDDRIETILGAAFGTTKLDAKTRFDMRASPPAGSGTVHLQSADLTPLLQSLALAFPDMAGRLPADVTGRVKLRMDKLAFDDLKGRFAGVGVTGALAWQDTEQEKPPLTGRLALDRLSTGSLMGLMLGPEQNAAPDADWSKMPFGASLVDAPRGAVTLEAKSFELLPGLTAANASLDIDMSPGVMRIDKLKADLGGGHVTANMRLRRDGGQATLESHVAADQVGIDLPAINGRLTGGLDVAGSGGSALALVSSLAGSGEATLSNLAVKGADPKALPRIFDEIENDLLAVDEESVAHAFDEDAKGQLAAGQRRFGLSLASGDIRFDPKDPALPAQGPVASKIDATLDLARTKLDVHVGETLLALPKNWSGPPPTIVADTDDALRKATRSYDVSGFLNAVAARALARETARVEAYEFDLRERAFFNARLQTERRRETERLLAEEQARKAEEDRKARLEAARQDRLRKDKDDKQRATEEDQDKGTTAKDVPRQSNAPLRAIEPPPPLDLSPDGPPRPPRRPPESRLPSANATDPPRPPRRPALTDPLTFSR